MKKTGQCPKCESRDVLADARVIDLSDGNIPRDMTLATYSKPEALLFKGKQQTTVSAWVCLSCGFTELYADRPQDLRVG